MPQRFIERGPDNERPIDFMPDGKHFLGIVPTGTNGATGASASQQSQVAANQSAVRG
jgi:hypothetical protein